MYKIISTAALCTLLLSGCSDSASNKAPVFAAASVNSAMPENSTATGVTPSATDESPANLSYAITGPDAGVFTLGAGGALVFSAAPDFEAPTDSGADNEYIVQITATDGRGLTATMDVAIAVTDVNEAPVVTESESISVIENAAPNGIFQIVASDPESDALTYTLSQSDDSANFSIDAMGLISFTTTPDFELPNDGNGDNAYAIEAIVSDGILETSLALTVTVTDEPSAFTAVQAAAAGSPRLILFSWQHQDLLSAVSDIALQRSTDSGQSFQEIARTLASAQTINYELGLIDADYSGDYRLAALDTQGDALYVSNSAPMLAAIDPRDLIGSFNTLQMQPDAQFGSAVAVSADGNTVAIGAPGESSSATEIDGDQASTTAANAGAAFIFVRENGLWRSTAYLKPFNTDAGDRFGSSLALSDDGTRLLVGAPGEDSATSFVDGDETDNTSTDQGAAYVFDQSPTGWTQRGYLKGQRSLGFGEAVAISGQGQHIVVGSPAASGDTGMVHGYSWNGFRWELTETLFSPTGTSGERFGQSLASNSNATLLAIGAPGESLATGGTPGGATHYYTAPAPVTAANTVNEPGLFKQLQPTVAPNVVAPPTNHWTFASSLNIPGSDANDGFGSALAFSADGFTLAVSAPGEDSAPGSAPLISADNSMTDSGIVYLYEWDAPSTSMALAHALKANQAQTNDRWGHALAISGNGQRLIATSVAQSSDQGGLVSSLQVGGLAVDAGAAIVFNRDSGGWSHGTYLKSALPATLTQFGASAALDTLGQLALIGAPEDTGAGTGISAGSPAAQGDATGMLSLF